MTEPLMQALHCRCGWFGEEYSLVLKTTWTVTV